MLNQQRNSLWGRRRWRGVAVTLAASLPLTLAGPAAAAGSGWQPPQIAIVWPHNQQAQPTPVDQSQLVNVSVWPTGQTSCAQPDIPGAQGVVLGMARNNDPLTPLAVHPFFLLRTASGVQFPSAEFNDVPADLAAHPSDKYSFVVVGGIYTGGNTPTGNVWVHAADPRTYNPQPLHPTGFTTQANPPVDLRIQVVFPHDAQGRQQPVGQAPLVNVAVDIFQHGTTLSVRPDFLQAIPSRYAVSLGLQIATGNGPLRGDVSTSGASITPQQTSYDIGGQRYPRWVFNNVPVQPGQQYHFMAILAGLLGNAVTAGNQFPTVWTHAADARTYLPNPQAPPACTP